MSTALVTGAHDRTGPVAYALQTEGFETLALDDWTPDGNVLGPGSVHCYVQLPGALAFAGAHGPALVARVDAVTAVSPFLAESASVLLVADDLGWDQRRRDALALLTEAALADRGPDGVRVSVLGEYCSPGVIVDRARASLPSLADLAPGLGFADWRNEILTMTGTAGRTYFGWRDGDGRNCAAVLRGTVMSPLRPGACGPDGSRDFAWGTADTGAHLLARAVMADAVGMEWADELAGAFTHDVVANLPADGFELRMADVAAWLNRHAAAGPAAAG
jgi:uncharacterized protein DUF6166